MRLFDRVLPLFDGEAHTLHYDRLMQDRSLHQIARRYGVLSIVEMHSAAPRARMGVVPDETDGRFRRGRYQQYEPKPRLRGTHYGLYQHELDGRPCTHRLFSIDGQLVGGFIDDRRPTTDMPALDLLELEREQHGDRWSLTARYSLPCPNDSRATLEVDLAQQPLKDVTGGHRGMGNTDMKALRRLAIGWIRPINERHTVFWDVAGRRSDSESTISTIKRTFPHTRATRLRLADFHVGLIGAGLWSNAKAWDVHLAQHTEAARQEHRRQNPQDRPGHAARAARQVA